MEKTKMTQRDYFNEIIALAKANGRDDIVEFAEGRIEKLDAKSGSKKPTKTQIENAETMAVILEVLGTEGKTVSQLQASDDRLSVDKFKNQKITSLLTLLRKDGKVDKRVEGKSSLYFVV